MAISSIFPSSEDRGEGFATKKDTEAIFCCAYAQSMFVNDATEGNITLNKINDEQNMLDKINTERINIPQTGYYLINAFFRLVNTAGLDKEIYVYMKRSSAPIPSTMSTLCRVDTGFEESHGFSSVAYLKEGEYIYFTLLNSTGSNGAGISSGSTNSSRISVNKILTAGI